MQAKKYSKEKQQEEFYPEVRPLWRLFERLPFMLAAGFVAFSIVAVTLLLFGELKNILVWPLGIAASGLAMWFVGTRADVALPGTIRERRVVGLLALFLVCGWIGFNARYTAQDVFVYRDPGFYTVAGEWLRTHDSLNIQVPDVFGDGKAILPDTAGFETIPQTPDRLYVQAPHLLPVLLGLVGRIGGTSVMLHANVLFGGLALFVLYGFARCFMRPRWALMAMLVLSVSLPMLYFSRDTYSEPIDMLLVFGTLSLVWLAQKKSNKWLWLTAGLAAGAGTLSRIDAYLVMASLLLFVVAWLALTKRHERASVVNQSVYFLGGGAVVSLLGWLDVTRLSAEYYHALRSEFMSELLLVAAIVACGAVVVWISWHTQLLSWLDKKTVSWRPLAAVLAIFGLAALLASRPLWFAGHGPTNPIIFSLQQAAGQPLEHRTYAEQTLNWVQWYIGPVLTVLSMVGLALVARRIVRARRYMLLLPLFAVVFITMMVYLNMPRITPYQVWAARRFLPVVFPGLCIFGALALDNVDKLRVLKGKNSIRNVLLAIAVVLIFAYPLSVSRPFLRVRIETPQLAQINDVCKALPGKAAVLVAGNPGLHITQSVSTFCKVPTMRINNPKNACAATDMTCTIGRPGQKDLSAAARAAAGKGFQPVLVMVEEGGVLVPQDAKDAMSVVSSIAYNEYEMTIYHPPKHAGALPRTILAGRLNADGTTSPL